MATSADQADDEAASSKDAGSALPVRFVALTSRVTRCWRTTNQQRQNKGRERARTSALMLSSMRYSPSLRLKSMRYSFCAKCVYRKGANQRRRARART